MLCFSVVLRGFIAVAFKCSPTPPSVFFFHRSYMASDNGDHDWVAGIYQPQGTVFYLGAGWITQAQGSCLNIESCSLYSSFHHGAQVLVLFGSVETIKGISVTPPQTFNEICT